MLIGQSWTTSYKGNEVPSTTMTKRNRIWHNFKIQIDPNLKYGYGELRASINRLVFDRSEVQFPTVSNVKKLNRIESIIPKES